MSEPLSYPSARAAQAMVAEGAAPTLGQLLRGLEQQHQKTCDADAAGCNRPAAVQHFLDIGGRGPPAMFALQLAWESQRERPEDIRATLAAIREARARAPGDGLPWGPGKALHEAAVCQHAG
jgi:hypothetical protein